MYANTLLNACTERQGEELLTEFGGGRLKERIAFIMNPPRKSLLSIPIAMLCLGLVIFSFASGEKKEAMSRTDTEDILLLEEPTQADDFIKEIIL